MAHPTRPQSDSTETSGQITLRVSDRPAEHVNGWSELTRPERWVAVQPPPRIDAPTVAAQTPLSRSRVAELGAMSPPSAETLTSNTTTELLSETQAALLNPNETVADPEVGGLLLGDAGGSGVAAGDTSLNNKVGGVGLTIVRAASVGDARDLEFSAFVDTTELNGETINEVGLVNNLTDERLFNHATINAVGKTNQNTVTVDGTIEFRSA